MGINQTNKEAVKQNTTVSIDCSLKSVPHGVGDDVGAVGAEVSVTETHRLSGGLVVLRSHLEEPEQYAWLRAL